MATTTSTAAAILSATIEPGDRFGQTLVADLGIDEALAWLMCEDPTGSPSVVAEAAAHERWQNAHSRYRDRLEYVSIDSELATLESLGGTLLTADSPQWPQNLRALGDAAPFALWALGNLPEKGQPTVTITGVRAATTYGTRVLEDLASALAHEGHAIITGGGYGIDTAATKGAIDAVVVATALTPQLNERAQCSTVVVLAGGLTRMYPTGNEDLFDGVLANNGAIISEMPPSYQPARWRFLERNRIIAALGDKTVIVESGIRSGSIATAHRAIYDLNRPVGVVPGPITCPTNAGTNALLRNLRVDVITSADDVLAMR